MQPTIHVTVIALLGLLAYAWVGYPLLLAALARSRNGGGRGSVRATSNAQRELLPYVTVILSAYNEEPVLKARLGNLISLDYPSGKVRVLIGTDGCTDKTAELAHRFASEHANIDVHEFGTNRGKVAVLRDLVARSAEQAVKNGNLLLFTDANTMFRPDALRRLVKHFSDPEIGGVCGRLALSGNRPEGAYWRWETKLKTYEAKLDSCIGANGSIYAIRSELFWRDIPDNTVVDDFVVGVKVREQGFRVVYDPEAVGEEELPQTSAEWTRRVRIGSGDYQAAVFCRRCLLPAYGKFAWMFWSHKILRWFTPHAILALAILCGTNVALYGAFPCDSAQAMRAVGMESGVLIGLGGFLVLVVAGRLGRQTTARALAIFRICDHFATMQAALLVGFFRFCRGGLSGSWARTPRGGQKSAIGDHNMEETSYD